MLAAHNYGSSAAPVTHADDLSGRTPALQKLAFGGLDLGKSATLPSGGSSAPLVELGGADVEATINDGSDTVVARVSADRLAIGTYQVARIYVTHVTSSIEATFHPATGPAVFGVFTHRLVLSESSLDGVPAYAGDLHHTFVAGGSTLAKFDCSTNSGDACPDVLPWSRGALALTIDKGIGWYELPVSLTVDASFAQHDSDLFFDVNVNEDVRWQDTSAAGFSPRVYDTTTTSYEPVMQFGPNSITAQLVAKP